MKTILDLQPSIVWKNFHNITRFPRPSKHEEKIRQYLLDWGNEHGFETFADKTGNVIIRVPATPGYEDHTGVILQGHMDMVPQKNSDVEHNFLLDAIKTRIVGEWVKACGTTLGADNGMGLAMALSIAEDPEAKHGPIEILVTYDEETGMTGANALEPDTLKGKILINLDSETEGELYVGCAGGLDASAKAEYGRKEWPEGFKCLAVNVTGCQGGHSGMDIILCRANANKVAARILYNLLKETDAKLVCMEGGTLRNAIPRECFSKILVKDTPLAKAVTERVAKELKAEYAQTDPDMKITVEASDAKEKFYVEESCALRFIEAILACPDGVERMSSSVPGLVETSNNLAMVKIKDGKFELSTLMRSSVDSAKIALSQKFTSVFELAGIECSFSGGYSGWAPNPESKILATMKEVYSGMYGKEPEVMAIHAGLECGILGGIYPEWDMISMGPTLMSPHSPDERCHIPSVGKTYDFLKEVLATI